MSRKDELGRLRGPGSRGRGGGGEAAGAVSCAWESSQESTQKIVTVLSPNHGLSGKDMLALFFTSGENEMRWEFTGGVRTARGILPAHEQTHGGACPRRTRRCAHTGPRAALPTPPVPGGGAAVELKRKKSLLVGQNAPNPNVPTPLKQNPSKREDPRLPEQAQVWSQTVKNILWQ